MIEDEEHEEWNALTLMRELAERGSVGDAEFIRLTKNLLKLKTGREWMHALMLRHNYMGSVFTEKMCPYEAARNDGKRELISDVLNSSTSNR